MSDIEKLARDICWAGFIGPGRPKGGKTAYWRGIAPDARAQYVREAKWLLFITKKLKPARIWALVAA